MRALLTLNTHQVEEFLTSERVPVARPKVQPTFSWRPSAAVACTAHKGLIHKGVVSALLRELRDESTQILRCSVSTTHEREHLETAAAALGRTRYTFRLLETAEELSK